MISRRKLLASLPAVIISAFTPKKTNNYSLLPTPQFRIGQRVKTWHDLEGFPELVEETGTVRGLRWQPDGWRIKVGWVYQVWFPPNQLLESDSYCADIPEFELEHC
ncbi:MAG: hypothetical protein V7K92_08820 [Nostoc sp.]|uniref:hypothetical protein n=1 Tax=Nostoc sp. TaxID=1180 RepID=UPI002FF07E5E